MGMRPESQVRNAAPSAARQTGEKLYCLTGDRKAPADQPPGRFVADSPLEEAVSSEPVSEDKFPIQGILFVGASECDYWLGIQHQIQWFASQFPTHRNREFISA
jgi:hypothetical protein